MPFLDLHGTKLRFREAGADRPGPPLLLVHGAGASSAMWLGVMHRLARHRRTVAIDLPGHGRSGGRVETVEEMRDAVGLAAAALGLPPSVVVGHSMGGLVALAAALAWPDKVVALGLVCTAARLKVADAIFETLRAAWPRWPALVAETAYSPETPAETRRRGAAIAVAAAQEQTIADFRACTRVDHRPALPRIAAPTLVVTGAHDLLTPPRWGEALAAGIPGARLVALRPCGHMPMHEQPDALAAALRALGT